MDPGKRLLGFPFGDCVGLNRRRGISFGEGSASSFIAIHTDATHKYETTNMFFGGDLRQLSSCMYVDCAIKALASGAAPIGRAVRPRREIYYCIDPLHDLCPTRKAADIAGCDGNRAFTPRLASHDAPHLVSALLEQQAQPRAHEAIGTCYEDHAHLSLRPRSEQSVLEPAAHGVIGEGPRRLEKAE